MEKWNQIISNKLVTRNKEEYLSLSRHPPDTLFCTDEYVHINTKNQDPLLEILNITPGEQTNNDVIDSPVQTTEKK
jgi:hypothetical protein